MRNVEGLLCLRQVDRNTEVKAIVYSFNRGLMVVLSEKTSSALLVIVSIVNRTLEP